MDLVRPDPEGEPARSMAGMGDHPTGMALLSAIMLALYRRERTGKGGMVHTSLLANGFFANAFMAQAALCGAEVPMRPVRKDAANALSNHYRCKDQRWFILTAANEEKEWGRIPSAIGHPELVDDPRFATQADRQKNARMLIAMLDEIFAKEDMAHWRKVFNAMRITVGEVAKTADIVTSEQALASGVTVRGAEDNIGADLTIDSPIWVEGAAKQAPLPAPDIGQHTLEILAEAGYDEAAIADLRTRGALGSAG
jgi:crotonobetainyl-CoA:carnitine CoA-transferase CaiB-like acyl-CoA transferase